MNSISTVRSGVRRELLNYTLSLANCLASEAIYVIDSSNNILNIAYAKNGNTYRIITSGSSRTSIFYILINNTPGVCGVYLGPYNASTNTTKYDCISYTGGRVIWNYSFVMGSSIINLYMYGLDSGNLVPYLPASQYASLRILT